MGIFIGWIAPYIPISNQIYYQIMQSPATSLGNRSDISSYLGADVTALAVIIAVLIGFNASTLQIAGQLLSPALVRVILLSLAPFLVCWGLTTLVALYYLVLPPHFAAQIWQILLWFIAIVLLMIGYLWNLPWRLSGSHAAQWAARELRGTSIGNWENVDGYSILQTGVATAIERDDLSTVRSMAITIGNFLSIYKDKRAEMKNSYSNDIFRSLKNLLTGCMQHAATAPNAISYYLGFIIAGVILQGIATNNLQDDDNKDLFSVAFRAIRGSPERLDPLWTGVRHSLTRKGIHGGPLLLQFWQTHTDWQGDDPRWVKKLAWTLLSLHEGCWREIQSIESH